MIRGIPICGAALLTLGFFGLAACRQIVGISDQQSCSACTNQSCAHAKAACAASPACSALEGCLVTCNGDPGCRSQCTIDNPVVDRADIPAALDACLASKCSSSCGLTCGALSKVADPTGASACAACIQRYACTEAEACATNATCQQELLCRENCVTGDCIGACSVPAYDGTTPLCVEHCGPTQCVTNCPTTPDGGPSSPGFVAASLNSTFLVKLAKCQAECEIGNNWACVGHVEWPGVKGSQRALTLALVDIGASYAPVPGVSVKMCSGVDQSCDPPIDEEPTNSDGVVRVVDRTAAVNGLGLDGYLALSSPTLFPTTIQWGFPLSETNGILATTTPVFSSLEFPGLLAVPGVTIDPAMGHIGAVAVDCLGNQAPGISFSAEGLGPEAQVFYVNGGALTPQGPTDARGTAFFVNVLPGTYDLVATPDSLGVAASRQRVVVRAGALTEVAMSPTPVTTP